MWILNWFWMVDHVTFLLYFPTHSREQSAAVIVWGGQGHLFPWKLITNYWTGVNWQFHCITLQQSSWCKRKEKWLPSSDFARARHASLLTQHFFPFHLPWFILYIGGVVGVRARVLLLEGIRDKLHTVTKTKPRLQFSESVSWLLILAACQANVFCDLKTRESLSPFQARVICFWLTV